MWGAPEATALVTRLTPFIAKPPLVQNVWISPAYLPPDRRQLLNVAFDRRTPTLRTVKRRGGDLLLGLDFVVIRLVLRSRTRALRIGPSPLVEPEHAAEYGPLIMRLSLANRMLCFYEQAGDVTEPSLVQLLDPNVIDVMYSQHGTDILMGDVGELVPASAQSAIGPWMRDHRHISGAGGLLVDDALWLARVHPQTAGCQLPEAAFRFLMAACQFDAWRQTVSLSRAENGSGYWTEEETCPRCAARMTTDMGFVVCPGCQVAVDGKGEDAHGDE